MQLLRSLFLLLAAWLDKQLPQPILTPPVVPPVLPPPPHLSKIPVWALAIQHAEGGKPQDRNTRNHNPGNLKYTSYTASLGATPTDGNFCYFADYHTGFQALCQFLHDAATGKLHSYSPGMTLDAFTTVYASPPNANYINSVANALGVHITIQIKELL